MKYTGKRKERKKKGNDYLLLVLGSFIDPFFCFLKFFVGGKKKRSLSTTVETVDSFKVYFILE